MVLRIKKKKKKKKNFPQGSEVQLNIWKWYVDPLVNQYTHTHTHTHTKSDTNLLHETSRLFGDVCCANQHHITA
jgi:hypothetical protein